MALTSAVLAGVWCAVGLGLLYRELLGGKALRRLLTYLALASALPLVLFLITFQATRPSHPWHDLLGGGWAFVVIVLGVLVACSIPGMALPIKRDLKRLQLRDEGSELALYRRPEGWDRSRAASPGSESGAEANALFENALSDALTRPPKTATEPTTDIQGAVRIF